MGTKRPNPCGLHDVYGNVAEWCLDGADRYGSEGVTHPRGSNEKILRGVRGGSYAHGKVLSSDHGSLRCDLAKPQTGFRILLELE